MTGLDVSRLAPDDIVAALRSFPRRFRELVESVPPPDLPDEVVDHVDHVGRSIGMIAESMRQVLVQDRPVVHPAVVDDAAREWAHTGSTSVDDVLHFLDVECNSLADAVAHTASDAWTRTGTVATADREISALDLAREAVRTASEHLRAAEQRLRV